MNLSDLPPHLRGILVCALLATIAISAGAFALSFLALDAIASAGGLQWGRLSWVFPFCIDALLIVAELALVAASSVINPQTGRPESRLLPFMFMLAFGATSIWLNTTRVPAELRFVAAIPPIASICGTILIAFLVKLLARSLGRQMTYHAPPPPVLSAGPSTTVYRPDLAPYGMPGTLPPGVPGPWAPYGQMPSATTSGNPQTGQPALGANGGNGDQADALKRQAIEGYLARLSPDQLGKVTGSEIVVAVAEQNVPVTERYARMVLDAFRAAQKPIRAPKRKR